MSFRESLAARRARLAEAAAKRKAELAAEMNRAAAAALSKKEMDAYLSGQRRALAKEAGRAAPPPDKAQARAEARAKERAESAQTRAMIRGRAERWREERWREAWPRLAVRALPRAKGMRREWEIEAENLRLMVSREYWGEIKRQIFPEAMPAPERERAMRRTLRRKRARSRRGARPRRLSEREALNARILDYGRSLARDYRLAARIERNLGALAALDSERSAAGLPPLAEAQAANLSKAARFAFLGAGGMYAAGTAGLAAATMGPREALRAAVFPWLRAFGAEDSSISKLLLPEAPEGPEAEAGEREEAAFFEDRPKAAAVPEAAPAPAPGP